MYVTTHSPRSANGDCRSGTTASSPTNPPYLYESLTSWPDVPQPAHPGTALRALVEPVGMCVVGATGVVAVCTTVSGFLRHVPLLQACGPLVGVAAVLTLQQQWRLSSASRVEKASFVGMWLVQVVGLGLHQWSRCGGPTLWGALGFRASVVATHGLAVPMAQALTRGDQAHVLGISTPALGLASPYVLASGLGAVGGGWLMGGRALTSGGEIQAITSAVLVVLGALMCVCIPALMRSRLLQLGQEDLSSSDSDSWEQQF